MTALVEVEQLGKAFDASAPWLSRLIERQPRRVVQAVDGVSFRIERGRTAGLVGESGCGKSTVARLLVGLYRPDTGVVRFDGRALFGGGAPSADTATRRRLQMIFQDPYASLNPRWRVADIVGEPLLEQGLEPDRARRRERVAGLLAQVGLAASDLDRFAHQFSGGQRQRVSIARALASSPDFLVCDEPTSALDVSVQAQVLNLMRDLQRARGLTSLFISHNLAVVRHMCDEVGVMYLGRLVEWAERRTLFAMPRHPYTRLLIEAIPDVRHVGRVRRPMDGEVPNPLAPPAGCAFHPRCALADARCRRERPVLRQVGEARVACHAVEEGRS
jgi:peptide/nickel transport system ATP-binding protein